MNLSFLLSIYLAISKISELTSSFTLEYLHTSNQGPHIGGNYSNLGISWPIWATPTCSSFHFDPMQGYGICNWIIAHPLLVQHPAATFFFLNPPRPFFSSHPLFATFRKPLGSFVQTFAFLISPKLAQC
ncbi:hypothetical protein BGX38DRAFT_392666 [Terfezia claveryi]|nr:hypothetical protein BGX38DRAFT_392666 [Terfezia claveryi]